MKIRIICVGKLKEAYLGQAAAEYKKRLSRYCKLEILEVKDEKVPERLSEAQRAQAIAAEGERVLRHLEDNGAVITMEIGARALTSEAFAARIADFGLSGTSTITFVIGGSLGIAPAVLKRSDLSLSFSPMTFPHQLFRVMLLEQIYRAFKINNHETYHK
ncbi:23S rRNA (pseudouridine(1915)-N(3))-methyltransferase RlmH [Eubacterium barkeri]|uniref:Ribosomal RNA large subunit methyltransferase H n=1 Tax=Eubacterium barkeri TaxID=1528 RepID=A0A1H3CM15_EUBBA|nr:23S rRNA (pseudouridine(1915)-N(3))-methyltransferase RlmH [Eubacterium barkeri]SDX55080.1 23S rRNA (pseudouridine1915-N3)-methyltransferase [Eubacterium barkeri]